MKFTKPPTTFDQQIQLLESRGMAVPDHGRARHYLAHLNYYRLGAYWLPFEADHATHQFKLSTNFEDILNLYVFDRELRLLVMDAIERIEVSVRTQWANYLARRYGAHAFLNQSVFNNPNMYQRCLEALNDEISRSQETFVKHYLSKYTQPAMPPLWAVVEVMSLGQLSKWYTNIKKRHDRQAIAEIYDLDEVVLTSFLHHLTIIRNICAHHSRLWNRQFAFQMKIPRTRPAQILNSFNHAQSKKLYNTLVLLEYLMERISPGTHWKQRLIKLLQSHPAAEPVAMGFPDGWEILPVWKQT